MNVEIDGGASFAMNDDLSHCNGLQTIVKAKQTKEKKLSHDDLVGMLCVLEAEVQAKDIIIRALMHGRSGMAVPLSHLLTDSDYADTNIKRFNDVEEEIWLGEPTAHLNHVVAYHQLVREQMNSLTVSLQEQHSQIVHQLEEERRKHAVDTAQGDDVTYMLEKERERLSNQLEFEIGKRKKAEKEKDKLVAAISKERAEQKDFIESLFMDLKKYVQKIVGYESREGLLIKEIEKEREKTKLLLDEKTKLESLNSHSTLTYVSHSEELHMTPLHNSDTVEQESSETADALIYPDEKKPSGSKANIYKVQKTSHSVKQEPVGLSITIGSKIRFNGSPTTAKSKKTPPPAPPRVSSINRKSLPVNDTPPGKESQIPRPGEMSSRIARLRSSGTKSGSPTGSRIGVPVARKRPAAKTK